MQTKYLVAIVVLVALGVGAIYLLDTEQPGGVNVTLATRLIELIILVVTAIIGLKGNAAKLDKTIDEKGNEVKEAAAEPVKEAAKTVEKAAEAAKAKIDHAAAVAAQNLVNAATDLAEGKPDC